MKEEQTLERMGEEFESGEKEDGSANEENADLVGSAEEKEPSTVKPRDEEGSEKRQEDWEPQNEPKMEAESGQGESSRRRRRQRQELEQGPA